MLQARGWSAGIVTSIVLLSGFSSAQAATNAALVSAQAPKDAEYGSELPIYRPPTGKIPRARVGGVSRGNLGKDPNVIALVPDHIGLTLKRDPILYWYISQPTSLPIFFTLREHEGVRPIVELNLKSPEQAGFQTLRLKDLGTELEEQVPYNWFISVQRDPESPSTDIVSGGMIERVPYVEVLMLCRTQQPSESVRSYADCGLWYDALRLASERIDTAPCDEGLRRQRVELLRQIGLVELAEFDLKDMKDRCQP